MVSCLISWVGSRVRRLGDVQRRRKFHGPTPSMRWGVILVMYPGRGIGCRREDDIGPEIDIGEVLEGVGGTTLGHARGAVDDEIFQQPPLVDGGRRDRQRDAGVAAKVLELPLVRQCGEDDLITIEADPRGRYLRPSVLIERNHMRDSVALEECSCCLRKRNASHGWMLPVGHMSPLPAIVETRLRPTGARHIKTVLAGGIRRLRPCHADSPRFDTEALLVYPPSTGPILEPSACNPLKCRVRRHFNACEAAQL
jgi:hypothetical protein